MTERDYLLALHRIPELGPVALASLRDRFGSYRAVWHAKAGELRGVLSTRQISSFQEVRGQIRPQTVAAALDRAGTRTVTLLDDSYPTLLREIHAPPAVLYYRGELPESGMVAIVGTRRATDYGREMARSISTTLAEAGLTVVSGLAYGIDAVAHLAALEASGRTVAVLASPLDDIYPAPHRAMARRIEERGALATEYPPGMLAGKGLFPARNRIIAGLSRGTVVVEAPEKSGALITASHALEQGREVFAVPGSVLTPQSQGTHNLIRVGAELIRSGADVLESLGYDAPTAPPVRTTPATPTERRVFDALAEPRHFNQILEVTGLASAELGSLLTLMEVEGKVRHLGSNQYILR